MAYMRLEGEAAFRFWRNVENDLDLLDAVSLLPAETGGKRSQEIISAEVKLATFLANAAFGEEDVVRWRGVRRREYFLALSEMNPDTLQLCYGRECLTVEVVTGYEVRQLQLGRAIGYSVVVPLSREGYDDYLSNRVSAFQFRERHILRKGESIAPCCLYGEGVFHMKALANPKYFPETVQAVAVDKADFIFEDLFRHFGRFMPRLRFVDGGRKLQTDPPDRLPQVIFADNGAVARSLRSRGFIEPPNYPAKGLAGYPRYVLNLGDYNRPDLSAGEKKKIRDLLNAYRKAMGEERQPMVDFLEHDEQDTESLQNECFADVVVITMRQDEYDAVASRIGATTSRFCGNRTYSFGTVPGVSGKGLRLALIKTTQQGVGSAQDTARDAIEDLKPGLLMLVGIAGAVPDDEFTLGDVVVATRLHDFTVGAHVAGRPDEYTNLGGPMSKPVEDFVAALGGRKNELAGWNTSEAIGVPRPNVKLGNNLFTGSDDWKKKTRRALQRHFAKGCRAEPLFTVRPIASDGYLGKDPAVVRQWLDSARDLAAIEMELPGVYVAARRIKREVPVLAVRGISDVVGYKRSLEWTTYAANAAGSFTAAVLKILPKAWFRERTPSGQRE